ncbi:MAG TPA: response regulator [Opitutaceae bacterium]
MNLVKKILVVHADARARRRIVLTLAEAGYDVRAFSVTAPALETVSTEWFDLALVDSQLPGAGDFEFAESLKKAQPTIPIMLLVPALELEQIVRGIRMGLTDVLPSEEDPRPLLRRVDSLLRPDRVTSLADELTPADLAQVEDALSRFAAAEDAATTDPFAARGTDLREEVVRGAKERAALEAQVQRLTHERAALEAELKTLLAQNNDTLRLQADLADLGSQREMAAAAQAAIDAKARQLAVTRAEIARERTALEDEKRRLAEATPPLSRTDEELHRERHRLEALEGHLQDYDDRLRQEAGRLQQESMQIALERRRWHDDLDLLRAQESNLRAYEDRLRQMQARLEADRVSWGQNRTEPSRSPFRDDSSVHAAWEKLQRANELLEAERAVFRDERMALRDYDVSLKQRETKLKELETKLTEQEKRLRGLPPPPPPSASTAATAAPTSAFRSLTHAPFGLAKSIWGKGKA